MPYRNAAGTLERAAASVLASDRVDELIAIDDNDGAGDPSGLPDDPRVTRLCTGGIGIANALEAGRRATGARFLGRMDADDRCVAERFGPQLAALETDSSLGAVGSLASPFTDEGEVGEGFAHYIRWQNTLLSPRDHALALYIESPLCHPSTVLRASALDRIGGYRHGPFPEDYDLWLRLHDAGFRLSKVNTPGVHWRQSKGQATFTDPRYSRDAFANLKAPYLASYVKAKLAGRELVVWGAGATGKRAMRRLEPHGLVAARWLDIDPNKIGRTARGAPIVSMNDLPEDSFVLVLLGARGARGEALRHLKTRGLKHGPDFIAGA